MVADAVSIPVSSVELSLFLVKKKKKVQWFIFVSIYHLLYSNLTK